MPGSPLEHYDYTINEWSSGGFSSILEELPVDIKTIFDVGANGGGFTRVMLNRYPQAVVTAFEPVQRNYDELVKLVPEATCIKAAVFYGIKESKLYWRGDNCGACFISEVNAGDDKLPMNESTEVVTFESITKDVPDLIKLDVEGAEENILEHSTLTKKTPWLIIEWHPEHVPAREFFRQHLPNHKVLVNLEDKQFLLCLKSQS